MSIKNVFLNFLSIVIFFFLFYLIFKINYIFRTEELFGSQIFYTDIIAPGAFFALIKLSILIIVSIFLMTTFNALKINYKNIFSNLSKIQMLIVIISLSFFIKMIVLGFSISTTDHASVIIQNVFINGEFNTYKLYNYLAYAVYLLTDNYNFYLYLINIIFGSITMGVLYLIFSRFTEKDSSLFIVLFLSLLSIPLTSIAAYLRTDSMYILLFLSTFYYLIKLIQEDEIKDFIKLIVVLILSCLCRESTLYMLPLVIFILLFSKNNKLKYILISSFTVFSLSILIGSLNLKNHGMKSQYKEFHLLVKAMQYGYLNEKNIETYEQALSDDAKTLLYDINQSYVTFIPPHKREDFLKPRAEGYLQIKIREFLDWGLIRPDIENIFTKSKVTPYKGNIEIIVQNYISQLKDGPAYMNRSDLSSLMSKESLKYDNVTDRRLSEYIKGLVLDLFLSEKNKLSATSDLCKSDTDNLSRSKYQTECIINIIGGIDSKWMLARSDSSSYFLATQPYVWEFNKKDKKYKQHPNIKNITEIILQMPMLYITQSFLTMTTMTGYHPSPSNLIKISGVYESSILPNIISIELQKYFGWIINFWYIFCLYVFIYSILNKNIHARNLKVIISLIPIYYGLFISFSTFGEFYRHMLVIVPLILYNYIITLQILYNSSKDVVKFFIQPRT